MKIIVHQNVTKIRIRTNEFIQFLNLSSQLKWHDNLFLFQLNNFRKNGKKNQIEKA